MKADQVTGIKKAVILMNEIAVFYHDPSKRTRNLQEVIQQKCKKSLRIRLEQHCLTQWVEKQETVRLIKQLLPAVCALLDDIALWLGDANGKALLFSAYLNDAFVVALEVLLSVLEVTKPLSMRLQGATQDIQNVSESVRDCITTLREMHADKYFKKIFKNAEQQHGATVEMARINARQQNRENHSADSAEEGNRRLMYFPYLDVCLDQLCERFTAHPATVYDLSSLLPAYVIDADMSNLRAAAEAYECFLPEGAECFEAELMRWKAYRARKPSDCRPGNVLNAIKTARQLGTYSITETLLQIFETLPFTTATGKRSFSAVKLI